MMGRFNLVRKSFGNFSGRPLRLRAPFVYRHQGYHHDHPSTVRMVTKPYFPSIRSTRFNPYGNKTTADFRSKLSRGMEGIIPRTSRRTPPRARTAPDRRLCEIRTSPSHVFEPPVQAPRGHLVSRSPLASWPPGNRNDGNLPLFLFFIYLENPPASHPHSLIHPPSERFVRISASLGFRFPDPPLPTPFELEDFFVFVSSSSFSLSSFRLL